METPLQFYRIRDLVKLPELNPRAQLCEETITRYMESFDALPPVSIQEGTGVLVDGFHRVEAATRLGAEAIPVQMLDIPDEELHLYAGLGNCGHGRSLSRAERNRFIVRLVEQYGWPTERAARSVGVSHSTVTLAVREHQYNQALSDRLGEEVQVINSSHVQALYRVGAEQRAQLLDAVASKVDEDGRPRPLSGAELKSLVERMEDPTTPPDDLKRLLSDPLARPETAARRPPRSAARTDANPDGPPARPGTVGTRGVAGADPLRAELLQRAQAAAEERCASGPGPFDPDEAQLSWMEGEPSPDPGNRPSNGAPSPQTDGDVISAAGPANAHRPTAVAASPASSVVLLERGLEERTAAEALAEAERLLCDLCARMEDVELWDQLRSARDLVREALGMVGRER